MINRVGSFFNNRYIRKLKLTVLMFLFSMNSLLAFSIPSKSISSVVLATDAFSSIALIAATGTGIILVLAVFLILACVMAFVFAFRLSKKNQEMKIKDENIKKINAGLQETKLELENQKDLIAREYSETEKFYSILLESADDGISFYDREWNLKYANKAFYSIIGLDSASYMKADHSALYHPDDSDYDTRKVAAMTSKGFYDREVRIKHSDGHYVSLSTKSVVVKDNNGEVIGSLTISRDITSLRLVHEELIRANREAENSNRLKSSFLANISHEIRTPLNSVVGFSNLLLSNDLTNEIKAEYIEHINHNSEKLLQIIGDIIDLSRLESSQIEITYEEASLNGIITEIAEEARKIIRRNEKTIVLVVNNQFEDSVDLIFTDKVWLKRVLSHLMDNAIKFTLDGSITLSYGKENDHLVFRIRDTGIGINKENLDHIFEEFRQEIDGHHRPFEGLGVGLTLAKEVVERMGGKIYVQSEKGVGSEFSFSIPYRPAGASVKLKPKTHNNDFSEVQFNWSSRKCLIVDDNKDVLLYLNRVLTDTGIRIYSARSGAEALEILTSTPDIDVVLLDMQMPGMNGIETTRVIRQIRNDIPIIAQTAFIFEDDKDIILEAGCDACLIKPIRKDHLLTVMSSFLKSG